MELEFFSALKTFSVSFLRICRAVIAVSVMLVLASGIKKTGSPSFLATAKSSGYFYVINDLCAIQHRCNFKNKSKYINELQNLTFFFFFKMTVSNVASPFFF